MRNKIYTILFIFCLFPAVNLWAVQTPEEDVSKARLLLGPSRWIQLHYFLQTGYQSAKTTDENNDDYWSNDFYIKRSRIILNGQITKTVYFFFQSDDLKAGASNTDDSDENNSNGKDNLFTQDAYIQFKLYNEFQIYAGLLALPFNRQSCQSAATTLGVDLNNDMLPFNNYSNNNRDTGIMLRGLVANTFEYRVGIFRGLDRKVESENNVRNEKDLPRFTARIQLHGMEAEEGFFYSGNYLGKKSVFALGAGIDYQKDVFADGDTYKDHLAWSVDVALDLTMTGKNTIVAQGGFMKSDYNPAHGLNEDGTTLQYNKFYTAYAQFGTLVLGSLQPYIKYTLRRNRDAAENGSNINNKTIGIGLNYFILEHHANMKLYFNYPFEDNEDESGEKRAVFQLQIYM